MLYSCLNLMSSIDPRINYKTPFPIPSKVSLKLISCYG